MNCPKCNQDNPGDAKFCEKCGAKLGETEKVKEKTKEKSSEKQKEPEKKEVAVKLKIPSLPWKFILPVIGLLLLVGAAFFGYQALTNNPKAVVTKYLQALSKDDLTTALALVAPEERLAVKANLDNFYANIERYEIKKIKIKNVVVSDEEATVDVSLDFDMKMKDGQKISYKASKGTMVVYDGKTKVEVPISDSSKYSQTNIFLTSLELEKVKGRWYLIKGGI